MANLACDVLVTEARLHDAADSPNRTGMAVAPGEDVDLAAGAVADFWGVVRQLEDGREIEGIDYETHRTMAEHQLRQIAVAATEKFQLRKVVVHHRIGFVCAGEPSLFLRVSAPHRAAAFEASKWIVDELKKRVPIWKRPRFREASAVAGVADAGPRSTTAATILSRK
ncbi:MAG: molybdenum cofactor biosynthesis protein MoaE [Chthoniobacterales bacterium]